MTKKYQIYGIGNALVDYEIETTSEELAKLKVEKGVMTLIDAERQQQLYQAFHGKRHSRACGGSAANTIIGAQTLGSQTFYSCKVGDDEAGAFYRDDMLEHGVHSNLKSESLSHGDTGRCLVLITEDADRSMNTFLGVTSDISYQQVDEAALLESEFLYIEGYLSSSPVALQAAVKAMQFARKNSIRTAFSLSDPNMVKFCREGLQAIIGEGLDLLFCNQDEARLYSGKTSLEEITEELSKIAKIQVITLGAEGALIVSEGTMINIDGHSVKAVDTNGAGDLFAGSFLHALASGMDLQQAGRLASYASAQLVTEFGPRLNDEKISQVKDFMHSLN